MWLRIEDAGYMDEEGRLWLVGRVKWRVEKNNRTYWSTTVEQKVREGGKERMREGGMEGGKGEGGREEGRKEGGVREGGRSEGGREG